MYVTGPDDELFYMLRLLWQKPWGFAILPAFIIMPMAALLGYRFVNRVHVLLAMSGAQIGTVYFLIIGIMAASTLSRGNDAPISIALALGGLSLAIPSWRKIL